MTSRPLSRLLTAFLCVPRSPGSRPSPRVATTDLTTPDSCERRNRQVTLGFSAWPGWFPWQVAQEQGLFAKNDVNVELQATSTATPTASTRWPPERSTPTARHSTTRWPRSAAAPSRRSSSSTTTPPATTRSSLGTGITSVADLKGKKVAVEQGTVDHYLLLLALAEAELTKDDIELVPLTTDAAAAAFVAGQVDAVGAFAPFTTTALQRPGSRAIATSAEFPGAIPDHLVVTAALIQDRPAESRGW